MMNLQACVDVLLSSGTDDLIQAAEIASIAMEYGGATTTDEIRQLSLLMIHEVLEHRLMEIGDAVGHGSRPIFVYERIEFKPWELGWEAALQRVDSEWQRLGRIPKLGEICWLSNTEAGTRRVNAISEPS